MAVADGSDPKVTRCADDASVLDAERLVLRAPARFGTRALPAATLVGTVRLRCSRRCAAAWAKLIPAPVIYHPELGTVTVVAERPADGTTTRFHLGHLEQAYGDLLLTGLGCVIAGGTITSSTGQSISATTRCRGRP